MSIYDVYTLFDVAPVRAHGCYVYDEEDTEYLDFYGGHAVISIGHSHPYWVNRIQEQTANLSFYSNSVINNLQMELATKLCELSESENYDLFLCNSGAEANENALKLSVMNTRRSKLLCFTNGFHGRTTAAVSVTDKPKIKSLLDKCLEVTMIDFEDFESLEMALNTQEYAAVIVEAVQGIGGLKTPTDNFMQAIEYHAAKSKTIFIADEIQCGFGRTGKFFGFQYTGVTPDIISMAKGMGNGFPIGGILINPKKLPAKKGMLGSTFGGNHLACCSSLAVLEVIKQENLLHNVNIVGAYLGKKLGELPVTVSVMGKGLMLGVSFDFPIKELRNDLVYNYKVFTGSSSNPNQLRILPPLNISASDVDIFVEKLKQALSKY